MNNALGMMWESECDVSEGLEVSTGVMEAVKEMEAANEITLKHSDMIRQPLNNAGSYLLAHDKVDCLLICHSIYISLLRYQREVKRSNTP